MPSDFSKGFGNLGSLMGSTAAGAVGNIASGAANALFGGIQARRNWKYKKKEMALQQKYNLENMQKQFEYQQEAWNRENRYNDPRNASARWRLAGISPNAVFGNSPGGAGVAGSAGTPDVSNPSAGGNMDTSSYHPTLTPVEMMRVQNEKKVADSQADLNKALADKARGDTKDQDETKRGQKLYNDGLDLTNKLTASKVINQGTQNELDALDLRMKNELFDTTVKIEKQKAENLAKQYEQMNQQIAESAARENLTKAQVQEVASRIALNAAYSYLANTQAQWHGKVSQAQIDEFVAKATNLKELAEVAKSNKALTDVEKNLKALEYGDRSSVTSFNRTVGTALKYLSPLVLKM